MEMRIPTRYRRIAGDAKFFGFISQKGLKYVQDERIV